MINKIEHYSINNPASVYDEESLTALELAGRTAQKVNECADLVNKNEQDVADAKEYMVDNLDYFVERRIDELNESGQLETILLQRVGTGKVDKGGNEQVTMNMLAQDVKTAMTGGSVAVVGDGAVNTSNIVSKAVTNDKLLMSVRDVTMYTSATNGYTLPAFRISTANKTITKNADINPTYVLVTRDTRYNIALADLEINTSYWNGQGGVEFFIDPTAKILYVVPFFTRNDVVNNLLYAGGHSKGFTYRTNLLPYEIDGTLVSSNIIAHINTVSDVLLQTKYFSGYGAHPNSAIFDYNSDTHEVAFVGSWSKISLYSQARTYTVARDTLKVVVDVEDASSSAGYLGVWYDHTSNTLYFRGVDATPNDDLNICLYLGIITTSPLTLNRSTCILPFTINGEYYTYPNKAGRIWAKLEVQYNNPVGTMIKPRIDFNNRKLIIPHCSNLFGVFENAYHSLPMDTTKDIEIPFPTKEGFIYLVGGVNGLKFVDSSEFSTVDNIYSCDEFMYFGCVNETTKSINFTFDCEVVKTVSILGDSISTFTGYIPETNATYYNGSNCGVSHVNQTWWKRVLHRCGFELNKNNSWSGAMVSGGAGSSGTVRANQLDNGTSPDVILVYLGINDFNSGKELGSYDGKGVIPTSVTTFREAYAVMLNTIQKTYKNAKIYAMTLVPDQRTNADVTSPEVNTKGVYLTEYNDAIREIANALCVEVIDTACCGINYNNAAEYMGDYNEGLFLHPNANGHKLIAQKVIKTLLDSAE